MIASMATQKLLIWTICYAKACLPLIPVWRYWISGLLSAHTQQTITLPPKSWVPRTNGKSARAQSPNLTSSPTIMRYSTDHWQQIYIAPCIVKHDKGHQIAFRLKKLREAATVSQHDDLPVRCNLMKPCRQNVHLPKHLC